MTARRASAALAVVFGILLVVGLVFDVAWAGIVGFFGLVASAVGVALPLLGQGQGEWYDRDQERRARR